MIFPGHNGETVELKIINYQFPEDKTPLDYDSNWLYIFLDVKSKLGNWRVTDPSLLTWEVEELIGWFSKLSDNNTEIKNSIEFIEPNLSFELLKDGTQKTLRIKFDLESRPQTANDEIDYFIDCMLSPEELKTISENLSLELSKFPKR